MSSVGEDWGRRLRKTASEDWGGTADEDWRSQLRKTAVEDWRKTVEEDWGRQLRKTAEEDLGMAILSSNHDLQCFLVFASQ